MGDESMQVGPDCRSAELTSRPGQPFTYQKNRNQEQDKEQEQGKDKGKFKFTFKGQGQRAGVREIQATAHILKLSPR